MISKDLNDLTLIRLDNYQFHLQINQIQQSLSDQPNTTVSFRSTKYNGRFRVNQIQQSLSGQSTTPLVIITPTHPPIHHLPSTTIHHMDSPPPIIYPATSAPLLASAHLHEALCKGVNDAFMTCRYSNDDPSKCSDLALSVFKCADKLL